jgi:serine/threonine protein kinase
LVRKDCDTAVGPVRIRLPRGEWFFEPSRRLGDPGGFGEVFEGKGPGGGAVAVKRLKVSAAEAAHRELRIAEDLAGKSFSHVLDVLDSGEDAEFGGYYVVMPRAEYSLAQKLDEVNSYNLQEAVGILVQIADGLSEVPNIVHRDLKPGNVLFHDSKWKIADFGIARFVEEATSMNTVKDFLSAPYAAPEQWLGHRASPATDVYALSCLGYELLLGAPPFDGPTLADYQRQHTSATPPALADIDPRVRAILAAGLRKPQSGRPPIGRFIQVFREVRANPTPRKPVLGALQVANAKEVELAAKQAAQAENLRRQKEERDVQVQHGEGVLREVLNGLEDLTTSNAPDAQHVRGTGELKISLGSAELIAFIDGAVAPSMPFFRSKWDVLAMARIEVKQHKPHYWSHGATLWYMRLRPEVEYRWHEVSYKRNALINGPIDGPFAIQSVGDNIYAHADAAAGPGMHVIEVDFGPEPIDDEDSDSFFERWLTRFASAYEGRLRPF